MANPSEYRIRVLCRPRPLIDQEVKNGGSSATTKFNPSKNTVFHDKQHYLFDRVFDPDSTQEFVYEKAAKQIVTDVLRGYNGTIFVYGQTSSGKTWTMEGEIDGGEKMGIIPRIANDIFKHIEDMNAENVADDVIIHIKIAYFEIYNEKIQDLLNPKNPAVLCIHEDRNHVPYVKGVTEEFVSNREDLSKFLLIGRENRKASETSMNERSSRSHSVFQIQIEQENKTKQKKLTGKLHLVDLAGSEKVYKSQVKGKLLEEAIHINKSLSQLGIVITALAAQKREHIPYRNSKLTRILQQSLGGNSRTTIIVCCSPAASNEGETKSTLYFGQCAKTIRNVVVVNEEQTLTAEEWKRRYERERDKVMRLKAVENEVKRWRNGEQVPASEWSTTSEAINAKKAVMTPSMCESMLKSPGNDTLFGTSQIDQSVDDEKQRYEEELENLNQQIDDKNDELQVQLLELMEKERVIEQLKAECEKSSAEILGLTGQIAKNEEDYAELSSELQEIRMDLDKKNNLCDKLNAANEKMTSEIDKKNLEVRLLSNQCDDIRGACTGLKKRVCDSVQSMLKELSDQLDGANGGLHEKFISDEINDVEKVNFNEFLSQAKLIISQLTTEFKSNQTKLHQLKLMSDDTKKRLDTTTKELNASELQRMQLESRNEALQDSNDSYEREQRSLEDKLDQLTAKLVGILDNTATSKNNCSENGETETQHQHKNGRLSVGAFQQQKIILLESNLEKLASVHKQLVCDNAQLPELEKQHSERVKTLEAVLEEAKERAVKDRKKYQYELLCIKKAVEDREVKIPTRRSGVQIVVPIRPGHQNSPSSKKSTTPGI